MSAGDAVCQKLIERRTKFDLWRNTYQSLICAFWFCPFDQLYMGVVAPRLFSSKIV